MPFPAAAMPPHFCAMMLKKNILQLLLTLSVLQVQTVVAAQYKGGRNDGSSLATAKSLNILPNIYRGGNYDGSAAVKANGRNPLSNIYKGGYNDGAAVSVSFTLNYQPNIYTGGDGDGSHIAQDTGTNMLPQIYSGGDDDGFAVVIAYNANNSINIYAGGDGDGHAQAMTLAENQLQQIYTGGVGDGYAGILRKGLNVVAAAPFSAAFSGHWQQQDAVLTWSTGTSSGIQQYVLERSIGKDDRYTTIATLPGKGTFKHSDQRYTDHDVKDAGVVYYRITMINSEGRNVYTATVRLSQDVKFVDYLIYPNPGKGVFHITLSGTPAIETSQYRYRVLSNTGQLILTGNINNGKAQFDISRHAAGVYYVQILYAQQTIKTYTIILQH